MDATIIRLSAGWTQAFREIRLEALKNHPGAYYNTYEQELAWEPSRHAAGLDTAYVIGVVAEARQLVGIAALTSYESPHFAHKSRIGAVYAKPEHRGRGIGRRMLEHLLAVAEPRYEQVEIAVAAENLPALHLYESLGFERYGYEKHSAKLDTRYVDDILMVKFFPPPAA
jgi:ribosomal protein S18 acetylase RimI-like enzyme